MLVAREFRQGRELGRKGVALDGGRALDLGVVGEAILLRARDAVKPGNLFGGFAKRDRPFARHLRVRHAPAEDGVEQLLLPAVRRLALGQHVRGARHRFDAARDHRVALAESDRLRRGVDRLQARPAEPVDRHAGNLDREAREQHRHPRDVAIVLTALIGRAEINVVDLGSVDARALHDGAQRDGGKIVRAHARERAAIAPDRRSHGIDHPYLAHVSHPGGSLERAASANPESVGSVWPSSSMSRTRERTVRRERSPPSASARRCRIRVNRAPPISRPHATGPRIGVLARDASQRQRLRGSLPRRARRRRPR